MKAPTKAMVLAAGLGTRLRPLTNDLPKALVDVGGRTMLEITLERLRSFGVQNVILNVHHYADMMIEYLRAHKNFGMQIEVSREEELLDTGGGIKKAAWFFLEDGRDEPTLAVQDRTTSRYLLFDGEGQLCGRRAGRDGTAEMVRDCADAQPLAFSGIHVLSPRLLTKMSEEGAFPIIGTYLRLSGEGEKILAFRADQFQWRDLGKPENVTEAARELGYRVTE